MKEKAKKDVIEAIEIMKTNKTIGTFIKTLKDTIHAINLVMKTYLNTTPKK